MEQRKSSRGHDSGPNYLAVDLRENGQVPTSLITIDRTIQHQPHYTTIFTWWNMTNKTTVLKWFLDLCSIVWMIKMGHLREMVSMKG